MILSWFGHIGLILNRLLGMFIELVELFIQLDELVVQSVQFLLKILILTSLWYLFVSYVFCCAEKMRRGSRGQQLPRDEEDFPTYNFPQVVSQRTLAECRNK